MHSSLYLGMKAMKTIACFTSDRGAFEACREKILAGLIVFCIFFNGFVPRFAIDADDNNTLSQIIASQSILLQFFSFSSLPVKIVNDLVANAVNPLAAKNGKLPKKDHRNSSNSASDFSFISLDKKTNSGRFGYDRSMPQMENSCVVSSVSRHFALPGILINYLPGECSVFLIFLLLFIMLPRSALSENNSAIRMIKKELKTQLVHASWVFSFIKTNYFRERSQSCF